VEKGRKKSEKRWKKKKKKNRGGKKKKKLRAEKWKIISFFICGSGSGWVVARIFYCFFHGISIFCFARIDKTATHCHSHTSDTATLPFSHHHTLPHTATHCHTLPHTATHCHTLPHTATAAQKIPKN
jgi:hypothetical protein